MIPTETLINRLRDYAMSADFSLRRILREAADRLELKRGRWIVMNEGRTRFMCSRCEAKNYPQRFAYCPNCGAMMDLED
jgi:Zn finger protein HypA/HybF involved in hydrogenase expression